MNSPLDDLVRRYLDARTLAQSPPCTYRYRGAVRTREIERRRRLLREASNALEAAVGWKFPGTKL